MGGRIVSPQAAEALFYQAIELDGSGSIDCGEIPKMAVKQGVASFQGQVEVRSLEQTPEDRNAGEGLSEGYGELVRGRNVASAGQGLFQHPAYGEVSLYSEGEWDEGPVAHATATYSIPPTS